MKFTFGVLTFNQEFLIVETLESIKYQSVHFGKNMEIQLFIIDDASKDRTLEVCRIWAEKNKNLFSKVEIIKNKKNCGTVYNYNVLLKKIGTEHFKIIAGDDLISSGNIFKATNCLKDDEIHSHIMFSLEEGVVSCEDSYKMEFYYKMIEKKTRKKNLKYFRRGGYLNTPSTLYTKKLYKSGKCEELNRQFRLFEDDPTWYSMIRNVTNLKIFFCAKPVVLYRLHSNSVSNGDKKKLVASEFDRELEKLRNIYLKETKGYEHLYLWSKFHLEIPKYLRINLYEEKIKGIIMRNKLQKSKKYLSFSKRIEEMIKDEQKFYNQIKKSSDEFINEFVNWE